MSVPVLISLLNLNSDIVVAEKTHPIGDQYLKWSISHFGEVGLIIGKLLIIKEKDIFPIISFGIETESAIPHPPEKFCIVEPVS
jgi:hypothetical protein